MAGLQAIRRKLVSIRNTRKITYAMKLVSAAKLRKAQEAVGKARDYTNALQRLMGELVAEGAASVSHPLLEGRTETKRVRVLFVGGSRGLCGGYNSNLYKRISALIREIRGAATPAEVDFVPLGRKAVEYCRKANQTIINGYEALPEDPNRWPIDDICFDLEQAYLKGEVDQVILVYTKFRSAISQQVMVERLMPFEAKQEGGTSGEEAAGVTLFEPSVATVFAALIPRMIRSKVRQACLDAKASEHGSRMTAMDSATKNAGEISVKLNREYNRKRQSGITAELLDIIGAAEAVK